MTPSWKRRLEALARSHVAAALLGLAIAQAIWWNMGDGLRAVKNGITRLPLDDAAYLAFRFLASHEALPRAMGSIGNIY